MTNIVPTVPEALDDLAESIAALAIALRARDQDASTSPQDAPGGDLRDEQGRTPPAPSFDDLPPEEWEEPQETATEYTVRRLQEGQHGSAAVCPAHNIKYLKGRYGFYCPSLSDDPKWSNEKGYCVVTPKSAAAWLRQHA